MDIKITSSRSCSGKKPEDEDDNSNIECYITFIGIIFSGVVFVVFFAVAAVCCSFSLVVDVQLMAQTTKSSINNRIGF